jgi:hypothetical protein
MNQQKKDTARESREWTRMADDMGLTAHRSASNRLHTEDSLGRNTWILTAENAKSTKRRISLCSLRSLWFLLHSFFSSSCRSFSIFAPIRVIRGQLSDFA